MLRWRGKYLYGSGNPSDLELLPLTWTAHLALVARCAISLAILTGILNPCARRLYSASRIGCEIVLSANNIKCAYSGVHGNSSSSYWVSRCLLDVLEAYEAPTVQRVKQPISFVRLHLAKLFGLRVHGWLLPSMTGISFLKALW